MNGAPKHALNVACGSVSPTSVPASLAVKPCTKWYITSLPSRIDTGGSTPKASAVSSTMVSGWTPRAPSATFGLHDSGYEKRVFSVIERSARSSSRRVRLLDPLPRQRRHVLDDRPRHRQRRRDDGLGLLVQVDELRVAAVLEVGDAGTGPARLVVADQAAAGVRRQRRLAGTGKAEQDRGIATVAGVRRAVHGQEALAREEEVHHREDHLLDESAVVGPSRDEADPVAEIDDRGAVGQAAVTLGVAPEGLHVEHRPAPVFRVLHSLDVLREHVVREHRMDGVLAHEPVGDRVRRIGARPHVLHVEGPAPRVHVLDDTAQQPFVPIGVTGLEVVLPPHPAFDFRPGHRERVRDGPPGAGGVGMEHERTVDPEGWWDGTCDRYRDHRGERGPGRWRSRPRRGAPWAGCT